MNSLLSDTVTTMVLDMNNYNTNTYVQNSIADAGLPIQHTTSIYGGGWRYVNDNTTQPGVVNTATSIWNKMNWYFFSNSSNNSSYAYNRFTCAFIRLQFNLQSTVSSNNRPFFVIYTLPQNSGNGSSWYRSRKVYTNQSDVPLVNKDVVMYIGTDPRLCGFSNINAEQFIQLTYTNSSLTYTGPSGQSDIQSSEVISLLAWNTNSASSKGSVDFTCVEMGSAIGSTLNKVITFY
jgi:hypothetical protein